MSRKRLGVLVGQAEESTQNGIIRGFMQQAYEYDYDVCVFSTNQKCQETLGRDIGDSSIFSLINYDKFDGIVYMKDTIQNKNNKAEELEEEIHEHFHGPVLVLDSDSKYYETVLIDHYSPFKKLIDHLIEVHGYKNIMFLNGRINHPHSVQRLQAYMDGMKSHGLKVTEDMIVYGDYWYNSGHSLADRLNKERHNLPEAVACANECMAIGLCERLETYGIKVPADIAVIGYDSTEEGRMSPYPLTSAFVPAVSTGENLANRLHSMISGELEKEKIIEEELYIGESCGCLKCKDEKVKNVRRLKWATEDSRIGFFSSSNHFVDDLLAQTDAKEFCNDVFRYVYQIRDFESFSICLNDDWNDSISLTDGAANHHRFSDQMYRIIKCGREEFVGNVISFDDAFSKSDMLSELYEEREYPTTFFFSPLYFEDRVFGFTTINFGTEIKVYSELYRMWLRSIVQCFESFHRQNAMKKMIEKIESSNVRDSLTGLYNYRGFLTKSRELENAGRLKNHNITITSIDLCQLKDINTVYGRQEGDIAINVLAKAISESIVRGEIAVRMGNDEFIIGSVTFTEQTIHGERLLADVKNKIDAYNSTKEKPYILEICGGTLSRVVDGMEELEYLVNDAVNAKNRVKQELNHKRELDKILSKEDLENEGIVKDILDNNKLIYHFQPIVDAKTGAIYAYEALMRADTEKKLPPPVIIKCAERMGRIYEIEKLTFFNVINYIKTHESEFEGKKVFVNSIPSIQLKEEDRLVLLDYFKEYTGKIVIEYTEEKEIDATSIAYLNDMLKRFNVETAIDDYGSGYSNINNLLRYSPKYVKIDRMLIEEIQDNPQKQHFVNEIIKYSHDNDIITLAEGVETTLELKKVIDLGVDLIQGYYTAKPAPVPLEKIEEKICEEIVQYTHVDLYKQERKFHVISENKSESLVQVAMYNCSEIHITSKEKNDVKRQNVKLSHVEIYGAIGYDSNITIKVLDNFNGNLTLNTVSLAGLKGQPVISIGENCNVNLILIGDNKLRTGGILVPESSNLVISGDGSLFIDVDSGRYFGIGNNYREKHGKLTFNHDGMICIRGNGMRGIGIGSKLGGVIEINSGCYDIETNGQRVVGIGTHESESKIRIKEGDLTLTGNASSYVGIGSYERAASVDIVDSSVRISGIASEMVGVGTLEGDKVDFSFERGLCNIKPQGLNRAYGIGGPNASATINLDSVHLIVDIKADKALALGDDKHLSEARMLNSTIDFNVNNECEEDLGITPDNFHMIEGRMSRIHNGDISFRE